MKNTLLLFDQHEENRKNVIRLIPIIISEESRKTASILQKHYQHLPNLELVIRTMYDVSFQNLKMILQEQPLGYFLSLINLDVTTYQDLYSQTLHAIYQRNETFCFFTDTLQEHNINCPHNQKIIKQINFYIKN